jgi:DNA-directed RNA polymerase delta subunit
MQELTGHMTHLEIMDIAQAIKEKKGIDIKFKELFNTLTRLEGYGFVKRGITSVQNQPRLVWKTQ